MLILDYPINNESNSNVSLDTAHCKHLVWHFACECVHCVLLLYYAVSALLMLSSCASVSLQRDHTSLPLLSINLHHPSPQNPFSRRIIGQRNTHPNRWSLMLFECWCNGRYSHYGLAKFNSQNMKLSIVPLVIWF